MKSIRRQLTRTLLPAIAGLFAVSGVLVWLLVRASLIQQFDEALLARARVLEINLEEDEGELEIDKNMFEQPGGGTHPLFEVLDARQKLVLSSARSKVARFPQPPVPPGEEPVWYDVSLPGGMRGRAVALRVNPAADPDRLFQGLTLITVLPAPELGSTLRPLLWVLTGTGITALLVLVPLLQTRLRQGLHPLEILANRTAAIDAKRLDVRLPADDCPRELQPVILTLNELLGRLEASFAREKRFGSDVAHELRTPVAELRSLAEMVHRWPEHGTPAAFADVLAIAREMEETVDRLSLLARSDAGTEILQMSAVAVDQLVLETLERFAPEVASRKLVLEAQVQPRTHEGDPGFWRMILLNVIGNAVHHAPPESTVRVVLGESGLMVSNPAPELEPADLPHLFERFWRKDASRTGYGHSGLGLSLVHSLGSLQGVPPVASLDENHWLTLRFSF